MKKIKVLAYCDAPTCATGFATVSRNILMGLYNTGRYDIEVLGINYWGDKHEFPWWQHIMGLNPDKDPYGRKKAFNMIVAMEYDLLFFLQDTFILSFLPQLHDQLSTVGRCFRSVCYFPVDGVPYEDWIKNINVCDYPVAYSEFGKRMSKEVYPNVKDLIVIPHGANTSDYFPVHKKEADSFRSQFFGNVSNNFIFTNLNRNQQRKDIPRTIAAFAELKKDIKDITLYLHMAKEDQGWKLDQVVKNYGLNTDEDVIFPSNFNVNQGYPRNIVNLIYNASDCVVSTSLGEGMGLSWLEAMATKTPVIMPDNTAMSEFITEDRGYLVKSGGAPSLYTVCRTDNEVIRPLVDVEDMTKKMRHVYENREEAKRKAENAYTWIQTQMDWQSCIVPQWVKVFDAAYTDLKIGKNRNLAHEKNVIESESF
jgi:D-inositol-3-phosphate glycosyltransferase